ncbi:hypothetical protein [Ferrimicrobium acidiphilum]|uniref:Uncharacterized protein n=1 Tax=Ferrimicrobium acidiphilum DSM 19497 TaxID=1121877 RepID=A0A0D8FRV9_9ACTN|nr:hypothetical protein [Ferrimicrobium acidiphilum]KJE75699.1 hypothetical protein FEAC_25410 [Ferrimicrobium acidiphilum DSM 19497]
MASKPTDAQRAILREKARADNHAMHAALTAAERLADAKASRETTIAAADKALAEATSIYHSAIEELVSRVGKETTAELLGTEAISAVRHAKR